MKVLESLHIGPGTDFNKLCWPKLAVIEWHQGKEILGECSEHKKCNSEANSFHQAETEIKYRDGN